MIARLSLQGVPPRDALERLIARHGTWAVLLGVIAALLRPHRKRMRRAQVLPTTQLSPHMQRDLGLPPQTAPQPSRYWDHF